MVTCRRHDIHYLSSQCSTHIMTVRQAVPLISVTLFAGTRVSGTHVCCLPLDIFISPIICFGFHLPRILWESVNIMEDHVILYHALLSGMILLPKWLLFVKRLSPPVHLRLQFPTIGHLVVKVLWIWLRLYARHAINRVISAFSMILR